MPGAGNSTPSGRPGGDDEQGYKVSYYKPPAGLTGGFGAVPPGWTVWALKYDKDESGVVARLVGPPGEEGKWEFAAYESEHAALADIRAQLEALWPIGDLLTWTDNDRLVGGCDIRQLKTIHRRGTNAASNNDLVFLFRDETSFVRFHGGTHSVESDIELHMLQIRLVAGGPSPHITALKFSGLSLE
jgi:hypothetical protein